MLLSHIGREASWPMGKADVSLSLIGRRELEKSGRALKWYGKKVLFGLVKMDCFHNYLERIAGVLAPGENIVEASVGGENDGQYSPLYVNACPFQYIGYWKLLSETKLNNNISFEILFFSLSFIALQVLICFWSLLQFKGYIYLNLSFISKPGHFQALNPKKWWQPKKVANMEDSFPGHPFQMFYRCLHREV